MKERQQITDFLKVATREQINEYLSLIQVKHYDIPFVVFLSKEEERITKQSSTTTCDTHHRHILD